MSGEDAQTAAIASGSSSRPAATTATPGRRPVRRSATFDEAAESRRRSSDAPPNLARRRSSVFSDHSQNETRRNLRDSILNPSGANLDDSEGPGWESVPVAFAVLPALAGVFFKNDSIIITDALLLGLGSLFLHWSVTQPWTWYQSAQEVRLGQELATERAMSEPDPRPSTAAAEAKPLSNIREDAASGDPPAATPVSRARDAAKRAALSELYAHEIVALAVCFFSPALGTYVLHAIRNQLSRPSGGLVSNFNLSIFLLAAEIRPLGHLIRLVQGRTMHLGRIVHAGPPPTPDQVEELARRLEAVEQHSEYVQSHMEDDMLNAVQPDLEDMKRAMRNFDKRLATLARETDARLAALNERLDDAIGLAATAARNNRTLFSFIGWLLKKWVGAITLPFRTVFGLVFSNKRARVPRQTARAAATRQGQAGKRK